MELKILFFISCGINILLLIDVIKTHICEEAARLKIRALVSAVQIIKKRIKTITPEEIDQLVDTTP